MIVLCDGKVVESGDAAQIFTNPQQPYTQKLLSAIPKFEREEWHSAASEDVPAVLQVSELYGYYRKESKSLFRKKEKVEVLHGLSLTIKKGQIVGLVGESGCGKTTLARILLGLHTDYSGTVRHATKYPQMVFQDAGSALNPMRTVDWILQEPLKNNTHLTARQRKDCVSEMLYLVGLEESLRNRYPQQLSGGQRQRVSIAAALMLQPEFFVADEPVSALDVTVQQQILALMKDIVRETGVSILLISHDLRVVYQLCDEVLVMKDGEIVESGTADALYRQPQHAYTKALLRSAGADF
jgi:oligopeptide/dipeptide ABC transporter ATP-binding protein